MTKLDEDIKGVKEKALEVKDEIDSRAPMWLVRIMSAIVYSEKTTWIFCGMATYAFGMIFYSTLQIPVWPVPDFVVCLLIFLMLLWYQGRAARAEE